ncbi:uncharacterized protein LOC142240767 [Haematobia irritans]|uniref:uncharacterized protein LOC142240767 n=1 Tax=Haematobia irritans TaxID=7368 RepID=UPI003F50B770
MDVCQNYSIGDNDKIPRNSEKIGYIYCSPRLQLSFACTICVGVKEELFLNNDKTMFITNEFAEFRDHMQKQHFARLNPNLNPPYSEKITKNISESEQVGSADRNSNMELSGEATHEQFLERNRSGSDNVNKHEPEIEINDVYISDSDISEHQTTQPVHDYNNTFLGRFQGSGSHVSKDNVALLENSLETSRNSFNLSPVHISNGDDDTQDYAPSLQMKSHDIVTIELSDDEDTNILETRSRRNSISDSMFNCNICSEMFLQREDLLLHRRIHNVTETLPLTEIRNADVCIPTPEASPVSPGNSVINPSQLSSISNTSKNPSPRVQCSTCGKHFSSKGRLKWHERTKHKPVTSEENKSCIICKKLIANTDMDRHMATEHNPLEQHPILSELLSRIHSNANIHHSTEAGQYKSRPFKCVLCGKRTGSVKTMIVHHHRFHSAEPHAETSRCEICQKLILIKNMRLHMTSVHKEYLNQNKSMENLARAFDFDVEYSTKAYESNLPSPSSSTSQTELTPEENEYLYQLFTGQDTASHSECLINNISSTLNEEDEEVISFGEVVPPKMDLDS